MAERRLARCGGNAALPVREYSPERLGDREEVFTSYRREQASRGYRDHSFTSQFFFGNNAILACAVSGTALISPACAAVGSKAGKNCC
jgi:hypothetical protein